MNTVRTSSFGWKTKYEFEGHTEGPWDADAPLGIHLKVGQTISAADARLIAAAPELLAEVKRLREMLNDKGYCHDCGEFEGHDEMTCMTEFHRLMNEPDEGDDE